MVLSFELRGAKVYSVEEIYARTGMTLTDAFNTFIQQSINVEGLPFLVTQNSKEALREQVIAVLMMDLKRAEERADKLREINKNISIQYGSKAAKTIVGSITGAIRELIANEKMGPAVDKMFGIISDYRYIYVSQNYVFDRIEKEYIRIINIYNEKEDFMWLLFGIDTTPQKTLEYWKE